MSQRRISLRVISAAFFLTTLTVFTFAGGWNRSFDWLIPADAGARSETAIAAAASLPMPNSPAPAVVIGTCDTAGPIEVESSGGTTAPTAYATLKLAFDAINAGTHTGAIDIEVCGNTTETASAILNSGAVGPASYTGVTIRPVGAGRIIEGTITGAVIKLNGADNVTIDGRQGGTGTARDLTVRNNSTATATAAVWLASVAAGNGASNNTVRNLEIAAGVDESSSSTNSTFGIIMSGTTVSATSNGVDNDNNAFIANRIIRARYGIVTRGTTSDLNINPVVTDNIVGPTAFGPDQIGKVGIFMQADTGALVSRNTVQFVGCLEPQACTGADRMGIAIGNESWSTSPGTITSNTYTVTNNVIHDVVEELTFSVVGIDLATTGGGSATNNLVANNMLYNIRSNGTSGDMVVGIGIAGGHTDTVAFNSIAMTGDVDPGAAAASTNFGSGIRLGTASGSTHANLTLSNNSVYMDLSSSSTPALRFYAISGPSASYAFGTGGENFNNYYINPANTQLQTGGLGTTSGGTLTTQFATLANWQAAYTTPQDANSIQADPLYFSTTSDIHIQTASPNVNAGSAVAGIAVDIDAQARPNGAAPDIGADEFYPSPGSVQLSAATYSVTEGGMTATITATRSGGANGAISVDYASVPGGTATGGASCATGIDYVNASGTLSWGDLDSAAKTFTVTVCTDSAMESDETVNLAISNPTGGVTLGTPNAAVLTILNTTIFGSTVSVGTAEATTSLTNPGGLFNQINNGMLTGNLTVSITSDLTAETGAIALNQFAGGFTLTLQPVGARVISGGNANVLLDLDGADGVTIDGLNTGGNSLTIRNTAVGTGTAVRFINDASDNSIRNATLEGGGTSAVLSIGSGLTTGNDNISIIGNTIRDRSDIASIPFNSINLIGTSAAIANTNAVITGNQILNFAQAGIVIGTSDNVTFNDNDISQTAPRTTALFGIAVNSATGTNTIQGNRVHDLTTTLATTGIALNDARDTTVARNRIYNFPSTTGSTGALSGIVFNGASGTTATVTLTNNMVSIVPGFTNAQNIFGIRDFSFGGNTFNAYYNTVLVSGTGSGSSNTWACQRGFSAPTTFTMVNNICFNDRTGGTGNHFAAGDQSSNTGTFVSNYNIFVGTGATAANFYDKATSSTSVPVDFAAWQTGPPARDANSQSSNPGGNFTVANMFVSASDLHLNTAGTNPAANAGTPVMGITTDFDGNTRSATTPEVGADEIAPLNTPPTIVAVGVTRQAGSPAANSIIANVTDTESGNGAVTVTVTSANPSNGVTISNIVNTAGVISADVVAACGATNATFTLTASDGAAMATATLNVTVNANTGPTLTYANASVASGGATTVNPATGPSDNGSVSNIVVQSAGTYTGTISVNNTTGVVSVSGAAPAGAHTITIRATDNCGTATDATFTLTVTAPTGPVTVTATAGTASGAYANLTEAIAAVNAGTHQGAVVININQTITEPGTVVINSSGAGTALYTSILIRPTADGLSDSGPSAQGRGLIELNGADNVTIDGDNPNTAGINRNLTLQNTASSTTTFTSVVRIALAATIVNSADNVTVKNLNIAGSAAGRNISTATSTTASENTTFGIFAGPGGSTVSATTAPAAVTSVSTSVGTGATAANLNVSNNSVVTAARGVSINGSATTVFPGLQIRGNTIGNQTAGAADQIYAIGITAQGSANGVIANNTVWVEGYVASSASTHGINVGVNSATGTFTIDSNMVNRARNNNGQSWSAYGINLGGGSNHVVQNNFVSGVINDQTAGTGAFGTTFGAYGIRIASGTGHKVYHNSVHLYGAMGGVTSTNLTASLLVSATSQTGLDIRNNVLSNQISGGNPAGTRNVVLYLPSGATSAMNLTLNNNAYYAGTNAQSRLAQVGATFGAGEYAASNFDPTATTPASNLRAYTSVLSAAGTNDNASFASSTPPPFTSNVNLHIAAGTATRLESGGAAVGVTTDIDAEARNATTPDIGADEFAGMAVNTHDVRPTALVTPADGAVLVAGSMFTPQATFTNNGTVTESSFVIVRYQIIDAGTNVIYNEEVTIPSIAPLQLVTVDFPATSLPPGTYTIRASSELSGDQDTSNDAISGTVTSVPPISGTIDVGSGQTFTSLTNAGGIFQALNTSGISGNVTINITSDLTAETGAVALNQLAESGAGGYTVTIKPSGAARTISGTSAASSALIILNGADRVVIDGSLAGGTDRSLTITNDQATTGVVIWMRSPNASNGATNNTIKNCIINGAPGPNSPTVAGVLTGSGATLGGDAEAANSNNTIQNNWIYRVQNSLYLRGGAAAANFDQNWNVTGNELGSSTAVDKNIFRGMLVGNAANFSITGNFVHGVQSSGTTTAAMSGIQLALLVSNGTIARNIISDIKNVSTTGTGSYGIQISSSSTASNVTIANNFVSDVAATGSTTTATSNGFGIMFNGSGSGYNVYFNSVNMNTDQTTPGISAALHVNSTFTTAGALNVRNNIFANTETTGSRYGVYSTAAAGVFSAIDYNDYFAPIVGFLGSDRATLADWQTATGQDANSKAVNPLFVSSADLHLQAASTLINMGVAGTGVTNDIDGSTRDAMPDIGADEITGPVTPGTLQFSSATYSGSESAGTFTVTVNRTGGSTGSVGVNYATSNGSATGGASCGNGVDFVNTSGTLTFADGVTSQTFTVTVCNDAVSEGSETINYTLSSPTGGAVLGSPSTAVQTIVDDDLPAGNLSINDVRLFEGNGGTTNAVFTVTFTGSGAASVQFATANGTATAGSDYVANTGTLTFGPPPVGDNGVPTPQTRTVNVVVNGDLVKEANETFFVNLSNAVNATIADGQGVGIIVDEDRSYVSDFDRDRAADFSVFRPSEGKWYVLQSTNNTPKIVALGTGAGDLAAPGDYDGDGKADYAVFRPSQSVWYILYSSDDSLHTVTWGIGEDKPVQGDYDGDGKTDIAVFRPSTGTWWVIRSSDATTYAASFGTNGDRPVQGDYDGDAKTDIAVYRDGVWYIFRSSTGSVQIQSFGLASDKPVSGDFDGDGKFDLTIYRDGQWWILNSLTGTVGTVQWGVAGDVPVSADYDADGTSDLAVFRPSNGIWYVLSSVTGTPFGVKWGVDTDVPVPAAYLPQ